MIKTDLITIFLILGGALILVLAMLQAYRIFKLVQEVRFKQGWRNLFILMIFFFIGYFGVAYIVATGEYAILQIMTGVIFFFGAVFVLIVSTMGFKTFQVLRKSNDSLEEKVRLLRTQNDQLTQFNYATSHDLKEPINTVVGSIEMLRNSFTDQLNEESVKWMDFATKGAIRMDELVTGLTEYTNVGLKNKRSRVDVGVLVQDVLAEMHGSIKEAEANISVSEMPVIDVYDKELKRVFQNLISNSLKYRKPVERPEIAISVKENVNEGLWEFCIQDNGIGIPEKEFGRIFQLFQQLDKEKKDGMGIGLAIVKKVIELHGGSIWVDSTEGKGTSFSFSIKSPPDTR